MTECFFGDKFTILSAFEVDKKTGGYKEKPLNITITAFGANGERDVLGTITINLSLSYG